MAKYIKYIVGHISYLPGSLALLEMGVHSCVACENFLKLVVVHALKLLQFLEFKTILAQASFIENDSVGVVPRQRDLDGIRWRRVPTDFER